MIAKTRATYIAMCEKIVVNAHAASGAQQHIVAMPTFFMLAAIERFGDMALLDGDVLYIATRR